MFAHQIICNLFCGWPFRTPSSIKSRSKVPPSPLQCKRTGRRPRALSTVLPGMRRGNHKSMFYVGMFKHCAIYVVILLTSPRHVCQEARPHRHRRPMEGPGHEMLSSLAQADGHGHNLMVGTLASRLSQAQTPTCPRFMCTLQFASHSQGFMVLNKRRPINDPFPMEVYLTMFEYCGEVFASQTPKHGQSLMT